MADLESTLTDLAAHLEWPETPDLLPRVRQDRVRRRPWFESRWALAAVAVVAIVAVLLAYTPTRTAIADWINLHTRITHTTTLPTPSPLPPGPIGKRLGLGNRVTLAQARQDVAWPVLVPGSLGSPDEGYVQVEDGPTGGEVTLVYGPETGIRVAGETGASVLITEARGSVDEQFFGKTVGPDTTVQDVTLGSYPGWWISGRPHIFIFIDSENQPRYDTLRLASNTLVIDEEGTIIRIEANLTESQALQLAGTLN